MPDGHNVAIADHLDLSHAIHAPVRLTRRKLDAGRRRLLKMHFESGVGHLGGNLSAFDAMMLTHHEMIGPQDRFILSKGHSAGAYYVVLWSLGLLSEADLCTFHRDGTLLAGHPPAKGLPTVQFSTGSLGHGLPLAGGLALAARLQGLDRRIFCLTSDGEWQEGSTFEALIFAAHRKLANLTILVDCNGLQGFGSTADVASMDPLAQRLSGFDVEVRICDGHDLASLRSAISHPAQDRPTVVIMHTVKGRGVPGMEGRMESHYLPLSEAAYQGAVARLEAGK